MLKDTPCRAGVGRVRMTREKKQERFIYTALVSVVQQLWDTITGVGNVCKGANF